MHVISAAGPPTAQLPPIPKIPQSSLADLRTALDYLGSLYNPEIRPNRHSYRTLSPGRSPSSSPACHDTIARRRSASDARNPPPGSQLDAVRADSFERTYAVRWLTALVARADQLVLDDVDAESLVRDAAGLLAVCAGTAAAGTRSRVFVFAHGVRVQLTDLPLDNQDYTSVGAQTWGGACLMADMLVHAPADFGLGPAPARPLRVLELGAGTGLVGLAAGKILAAHGAAAEVVCTDFHPAVLANLRSNIAANFARAGPAVSVCAAPLDWSAFAAPAPAHPASAPFDRPFDVVLGADIVYEPEHARWIRTCVAALLRTPPPETVAALAAPERQPPQPQPQFHLVVPLRATHAAESRTIEEVFPSAAAVRGGTDSPPEDAPVRRTLAVVAKEAVVCEDLARGSGEEVEYVHYTIAWV